MLSNWNLLLLGVEESPKWFAKHIVDLEELSKKLRETNCIFSDQVEAFERLDLLYDSIECAVTLLGLIEPEISFERMWKELERIEVLLADSTNDFICRLKKQPGKALPNWTMAVFSEKENQIDTEGELQCLTSQVDVSQLRIRVMRAQYSHLDFSLYGSKYLPQRELKHIHENIKEGKFYAEARNYFTELIHEKQVTGHIDLTELYDLERDAWEKIALPLNDGIRTVIAAFSTLDVIYGEKVKKAYQEGRIRVREGLPSFCIDTPAGSYIQVCYKGDLESLALLAHECGHLVHQESVRDRYKLKQDIDPCLSEAIAIFFENKTVKYYSYFVSYSKIWHIWQKRQKIEWYCRHLLLGAFECKLYELDPLTEDNINALWVTLGRQFYPPQVRLNSDYSAGWKELGHIVHSPFYLLVYPSAYTLSLSLNIKTVIHCLDWEP